MGLSSRLPPTGPMRFFNTAGPMRPEDHYCIPPLSRIDEGELLTLVRQKRYFVLRILRLPLRQAIH